MSVVTLFLLHVSHYLHYYGYSQRIKNFPYNTYQSGIALSFKDNFLLFVNTAFEYDLS